MKGNFTPDSDFLPTKWKKIKTPSKEDEHHLDNIAPYLEDCGIDTSKIPTIEVEKFKNLLTEILSSHYLTFMYLDCQKDKAGRVEKTSSR